MVFNRIPQDWPLATGEQLKARLRTAIQGGELRPGSGLPKIRDLAAVLGINANTVAACYRDLVKEGLVDTRKRGGTRVAPGPFLPGPGDGEVRRSADRLIEAAKRWGWNGADVVRLIAGQWPSERQAAEAHAASVYDFLHGRDYDEG